MKKQISYKIVSLVFSVLVVCFAIVFYAIAWDEPVVPPPGGNIPAPLNTGDTSQIKQGPLSLNVLGASPTGLIVNRDAVFLNGNVGIGTTSPSVGEEALKLDVEGAIGATKYCDQDGNNCKTIAEMAGGGGALALGQWESTDSGQAECNGGACAGAVLAINIVYRANTDGFVLARGAYQKGFDFRGYTDSTSATTLRLREQMEAVGNGNGSFTMPVRKDDYWKITGNLSSIYWIPIVSGGGGGGGGGTLSCITIADTTTKTITCPGDRTVTGGGGYCAVSGGVYTSKPNGNGWWVDCTSGETPNNIYAVCCNIQ